MNSNYIGILVGGIVPAIIFGIGGVFVKASNQQGISLNYYILFTCLGVLVISLISFFIFNEKMVNFNSGTYAFIVGATIISALNCTACLVTILLALVIFSEWKETKVIRLLVGSIMIVVGAMLVSTSSNGNTNEQQIEVVKENVNKLP